MKMPTAVFLAGTVFVAGCTTFAGRDESQTMQQQHAVKETWAEKLLKAKNIPIPERGLAGPTGMPGKVGPEGQPTQPGKDPTAHP